MDAERIPARGVARGLLTLGTARGSWWQRVGEETAAKGKTEFPNSVDCPRPCWDFEKLFCGYCYSNSWKVFCLYPLGLPQISPLLLHWDTSTWVPSHHHLSLCWVWSVAFPDKPPPRCTSRLPALPASAFPIFNLLSTLQPGWFF